MGGKRGQRCVESLAIEHFIGHSETDGIVGSLLRTVVFDGQRHLDGKTLLHLLKIALAGTQDAEVVFSHNATANSTDRVEVTVRQPGSAEER